MFPGPGIKPATEDTLMMPPRRRPIIPGSAARVSRSVASTCSRCMASSTTDVSDAGDASLMIRLDDNVPELLWSCEPPQNLDVNLITRVGGNRRLIQNTGGNLRVLRAQSDQNVTGADIVRRGFVRFDPDS